MMKRIAEENTKPIKKVKKLKKNLLKCEDQVLEKDEENLECHEKLIKKKSCKRNKMENDISTKSEENFSESLTKEHVDNDNTTLKKKKKKKKKDEADMNESSKKRNCLGGEKVSKKKKVKVITNSKEDQIIEESSNSVEKNENESKDVKKSEPSKRQLKKEKAEMRAAVAKEASKQEAAQKAMNYVSQWKYAKNQWKFEKLKQIWLINNFMDEKYIPETNFLIILEYFEGCKGFAKKQLLEKAEAVIKKAEESYEENEEIIESTEYKRAKQLIQALPNET